MTPRYHALFVRFASEPPVCLAAGAADLEFGGEIYLARHEALGSLTGVGGSGTGLTGEAPRSAVSLSGATAPDGLDWLLDEARTGEEVRVYTGVYDPATGDVGEVRLELRGELGQPEVSIGGIISASLPVISFVNRGFEPREGWNYNDGTQRRLYPDDAGFGFVMVAGEKVFPAGGEAAQPPRSTAGRTRYSNTDVEGS